MIFSFGLWRTIAFPQSGSNLFQDLDALVPSILLALLIFLMGLEFFLNTNDVAGDTVKARLREWAYGKYFFVTFLWGVLTGHFFFGSENPIIKKTEWSVLAIVLMSVLLMIWGRYLKNPLKAKHQLGLLLFGVLFGHFFFSMNYNP